MLVNDPNVPRVPQTTYSAIILPTPVSIVSKIVIVLVVFGVYITGITMYTMRSEQYNFNGRMLWNFLMDKKDEMPPIQNTVRNVAAKGASSSVPHPSVPPVPHHPVASATRRAQRVIEDTKSDRIPESFVGSSSSSSSTTLGNIQSMLTRTWEQIYTRLLAWTHIRGNTLYSRKLFT